jgi:S-adenosylmethionine synthetase
MTLVTAESVTEGHPDKICDQISDAILDAILADDPWARVAVETVATRGLIQVVGEVTTDAYVEIQDIVRAKLIEIGYDSSLASFDGNTCGVSVSLGQQSPDIAGGIDNSREVRTGSSSDPMDAQGAGDQGVMFGYATDETPDLMPTPIWLAHRLARRLTEVRKQGIIAGLFPDGKTQVTMCYDDGVPKSVDTVVVSAQHSPTWEQEALAEIVTEKVIKPVLTDAGYGIEGVRILVNPSGRFVVGGPAGDAGLTGRKIIVDTYGGAAPHGGGAFSGKDPSKVDRSGAYAARWIAKCIVAAGFAHRVQIQVAYAIGSARPVSVSIETFGTETLPVAEIERAVSKTFDLRPLAILRDLDLLNVQYQTAAAYGHFGRPEFPWEDTAAAERLRAAAG